MLTSTKIQSTNIKVSSNSNRRKAILPTPNKPKNEQDLLVINSKTESNSKERITKLKVNHSQPHKKGVLYEFGNTTNESFVHCPNVLNIDSNANVENSVVYKNSYRQNKFNEVNKFDQSLDQRECCRKINIQNLLKRNSDIYDKLENYSQSENERNAESFDEFILRNFIPFTGRQNLLQWLDGTETKFNRFRIVRNLRYTAISLPVEGEARYKYLRHRRQIRSFDDFCEFLLVFMNALDLNSMIN